MALSLIFGQSTDPLTVTVDRSLHRIVAVRGYPLNTEIGGAINLSSLLTMRNRLQRFPAGDFWRSLWVKSVPAKKNIRFEIIRVALELDDGRRIAIDRDGRMAIVPKGIEDVIWWKGPVRELTNAQKDEMTKLTRALED